MSNIKIYQMNDYDWFAGENAADCISKWCNEYEYTEADYADEYSDNGKFPRPLTDAEMDRLVVVSVDENDAPDMSFRSALDIMTRRGDSFPAMFASTEY